VSFTSQKLFTMLIVTGMVGEIALAQNLPQATVLPGDKIIPSGVAQPDGQKARSLPGDQTIPSYETSDPEFKAAVERARNALQDLKNKHMGSVSGPSDVEDLPPAELQDAAVPLSDPAVKAQESLPLPELLPKTPRRVKRQNVKSLDLLRDDRSSYTDTKDGVRIFNQALQQPNSRGGDTYTLPATSIALATTLYGIEATSNVERLVPAELNYAWLGPNGTVVEMKNCRLWIAVRGDYSTERVYGRSKSMSCRTSSGETFDIPVEAHMVDQQEEYLGAKGTLVARGKALASALSFLSDGVKAFGSAMAAAQVNTEVTPSGGLGDPVKGSNVGGDKNKYIIGQTLSGTSSKFLDWWIEYYQSLSPTIAMGPGKKIYLALQNTIHVPKIFFGDRLTSGQIESAVGSFSGDGHHSVDSQKQVNTKSFLKISGSRALLGDDDGDSKL
jgi:hypothetical protein